MIMSLRINVEPFEFVPSGVRVRRLGGEPGAPGEVRDELHIEAADPVRRVVADELTPGAYTAVVRSPGAPEPRRVPFFVVETRGAVPAGVKIVGFVRLAVGPERMTRVSPFAPTAGPFVDVMKAVETGTDRPLSLAFDQDGRPVDFESLHAGRQAQRDKRLGKLDAALYAELQRANEQARLPVAVWLAGVGDESEEKAEEGATPEPRALRARRRLAVAEAVRRLVEGGALAAVEKRMTVDPDAPVVFAELSAAEIRTLAGSPGIAALFLAEDTGVLDLADAIAIANADDVHAGGAIGEGVRVAVWEDGIDETGQLVIAGEFDTTPTPTLHARLTHGIIRNREKGAPHGFAPGALLFSANSTRRVALRWALNHGCTVINQSFHRTAEARHADLSFDDIYKDWCALRWPFPLIVQAAGNINEVDEVEPPADEYVNHKGFNGLTIGSHKDSAGAMASSSVFRNPDSKHGDRELPELCANGNAVTIFGVNTSGTSLAAPAVAGAAALLQGESETLKSWPEGCRAILLAGARINVRDKTWWADVAAGTDARDGAGALDAAESVAIARHRRGRGLSGVRRGWDVGTLRSADFHAGTRLAKFVYRVTIPAGTKNHVKVALAWNSRVVKGVSTKLKVDFDLCVYDADGERVGYSGSWDNSYEVAEFDGEPGRTYEIKVRRWSGDDDAWYGIAWTVT